MRGRVMTFTFPKPKVTIYAEENGALSLTMLLNGLLEMEQLVKTMAFQFLFLLEFCMVLCHLH